MWMWEETDNNNDATYTAIGHQNLRETTHKNQNSTPFGQPCQTDAEQD